MAITEIYFISDQIIGSLTIIKAYYEYEDGTYWAIRTEGNDCYIYHGSKYFAFWPEFTLEAGVNEEKDYRGLWNVHRTTYADSRTAEIKGQKLAREKSAGALKENAEFWRIAIEINALLLFFVPREYKTKELCALAARREGSALKYVPFEMRDQELCMQAVKNDAGALKFVNEKYKSREMCERAVRMYSDMLEFVPDKYKTPELCDAAINDDGEDGYNLEYVPEEMKTYELCTKAVTETSRALKFVPDSHKTKELCFLAVSRPYTFRPTPGKEYVLCALAYIPPEFITKEVCLNAVNHDFESINFWPDKYKNLRHVPCGSKKRRYGVKIRTGRIQNR